MIYAKMTVFNNTKGIQYGDNLQRTGVSMPTNV